MRGWLTVLVMALMVTVGAATAHADPGIHGGRGDDHGDAFRPPEPGPEAAKSDYPKAKWSPASKKNYTNADRPDSEPITTVVIHTMQGSYAGTKAWFKNPASEVSAHYIVRSSDGQITQMVHESDIGWHAGNWDVNTRSIGIEHEGYVEDPKKWYTDTMYRSSAKLVRSICDRYGIPIDRKHIIGHVEVPGADHTDPGKGWDWKKYIALVKQGTDPDVDPVVVDDGTDAVDASTAWRTATAADANAGDYRHASPVKHSDPLWFATSIPVAGKYRVDVWYPTVDGLNDRAPYLVHDTTGYHSVYVDQRVGGGAWHSIGVFDLAAGDRPAVGVSRWTGGTGRIAADAVRLTAQ